MGLYLVTYDLFKPEQNYTKLTEAIETYEDGLHLLQSVWVIKTDESISEIFNKLNNPLDLINDKLLIVELTGKAKWLDFTKEERTWLNNHFDR